MNWTSPETIVAEPEDVRGVIRGFGEVRTRDVVALSPEVAGRAVRLGEIALRAERGVLHITAADMLRLRLNPFYSFIEAEVLRFTDLSWP